MYYTDTEIGEVGFGNVTNSNSYSNPNSFQCSFGDPTQSGNTYKITTGQGTSGT